MTIPALLVSYIFLPDFLRNRNGAKYRDWTLDSGAFSALSRDVTIDLDAYCATCLELLETDKTLVRIFALDVIGDPEASLRNAEIMGRYGIPVIPTFHYGSAWTYLDELAKKYSRIALGGLVQRGDNGIGSKLSWKDRLTFLEQCFARVWPKWIHGFGITDPRIILRLPFASVDSTSWYFRVRQYGRIEGYPGLPSPMVSKSRSGAKAATRCSLGQFLELEDKVRQRLGKFLTKVTKDKFTLRLATMASEEELSYFKG